MPSALSHLTSITSPPPEGSTLTLTVPARSGEVAGIRRAVGVVGRRADLDADRLADVALAVAEACANAVVHAYVGRAIGVLRVTADATPEGLQVVVADEGRGMASRSDSPGLGLGLPLMASLTTALEVCPSPAGGTEIRMAFAHADPDVADAWAQAS